MSLHRAEDIGQLIQTRLSTRTIANGAETDMGAQVFLGRRHVSDDLIPCTALIEGPDEPQNGAGDEYEVDLPFVAYAYVPCDPEHPNVAAHAAIRDIKRAIWPVTSPGGRPDKTLGGQVKRCVYRGREIGPRADGAAYVVAAVELAVTYVERLSQP